MHYFQNVCLHREFKRNISSYEKEIVNFRQTSEMSNLSFFTQNDHPIHINLVVDFHQYDERKHRTPLLINHRIEPYKLTRVYELKDMFFMSNDILVTWCNEDNSYYNASCFYSSYREQD